MHKSLNRASGRMSRYEIDIKERCYVCVKRGESVYQKRMYNKSHRRYQKAVIKEQIL